MTYYIVYIYVLYVAFLYSQGWNGSLVWHTVRGIVNSAPIAFLNRFLLATYTPLIPSPSNRWTFIPRAESSVFCWDLGPKLEHRPIIQSQQKCLSNKIMYSCNFGRADHFCFLVTQIHDNRLCGFFIGAKSRNDQPYIDMNSFG